MVAYASCAARASVDREVGRSLRRCASAIRGFRIEEKYDGQDSKNPDPLHRFPIVSCRRYIGGASDVSDACPHLPAVCT
jgi:hypothetical protein